METFILIIRVTTYLENQEIREKSASKIGQGNGQSQGIGKE